MSSRKADPVELYRRMARVRAFEEAVAELWRRGSISGEMHLGTGEEAIAAGISCHLDDRDAIALDHRPDPMLLLRNVPLVPMLREMLGEADGLAGGRAGHMHLMSRSHRIAASGIVGASAPLATGFALAARRLRPGGIAVSFFGDGAANQGLVFEAMNLAAAWRLPVLFVCKNNGWAITTRSATVTGGDLVSRALALGLVARRVDGLDAAAVFKESGRLIDSLRRGRRPAFLHASCSRLDGHFLGDLLVRSAEKPLSEGRTTLRSVISAAVTPGGARFRSRARGMVRMLGVMRRARGESRGGKNDPLVRARKSWRRHRRAFRRIDGEAAAEIRQAVAAATGELS